MLIKRIVFIIMVAVLLLIPASYADNNINDTVNDLDNKIIYFDASSTNDGDGSIDNPYNTLKTSRIEDNSIMYLADGEYEYEFDGSSKDINNNLIIGNSSQNTIIKYSETLFNVKGDLILKNLTIKGAPISNYNKLTCENVIFKDSSSNLGGVLYTSGSTDAYSNINLTNCIFEGNSANYGGSIYSYLSNVYINNCTFFTNTANALGGVICDLNSNFIIKNSKFHNNTALYGGAVYKIYGLLNVSSSDFYNNSADYYGGAVFSDNSTVNFNSNNFSSNIAGEGSAAYIISYDKHLTGNIYRNNELFETSVPNTIFENYDYIQRFYNSSYMGVLPSSYDLRDYGWVSPVKNQGSNGNCWAFASLASLESCLLKATGEVFDFSENNMKNIMATFSAYGWDNEVNKGGTTAMAIAYFTGWLGAVNESDDEYQLNSLISPLLDNVISIQNIIFLERKDYTDNDAIKKAILDYGAVYTSIYSTGSRNQYYNNAETTRNHAVSIIGWDDNYSKNNFGIRPPGNGAWICKNSWGENWGYNGYFYVSYYDVSLAKVNDSKASYTFILNDTVKYNRNYQYDISGVTDYFLTDQKYAWYQNIFNSTSDETIAAFSTYFNDDTNWTAQIYVNDELKTTQSGFSHSGYYTFNLDEFIPVNAGDIFKIVLKINTDSEALIPISEKASLLRTLYKPEISYFSYDGENWYDFYNYTINMSDRGHWYNSQVAALKIFTVNELLTETVLDEIPSNISKTDIIAHVNDQYGNSVNIGNVEFKVNNKVYTVAVVKGIANLTNIYLNYGLNNITSTYILNSHYSSSTDNKIINTRVKGVNLTANISYSINNGVLTADVSLKALDGNLIDSQINLTINGKKYLLQSNQRTLVNTNLNPGNYSYKIEYPGNGIYESASYTDNLIVSRFPSTLNVNIPNIYYSEDLLVYANLTGINNVKLDATLIININNKNYSFKSNSIYKLPDTLNASGYAATIIFEGNSIYDGSSKSVTFDVKKLNETMTLSVDKSINNAKITVNLSGNINETVSIFVNNSSHNITTINGKGELNLTNFNIGDYHVSAVLNKTNYEFIRADDDFSIDIIPTKIIANNITTYYQDGTRLRITLKDFNDNPLANKNISVLLNGVKYIRTTGSNGDTSVGINLSPNNYSVFISFDGDDLYYKSNNTVYSNVKSTIIGNDLIKYYRNSSQFICQVNDYNGNPLKNTSVEMNINGVLYKRTSDSNGFFKLNINLPPMDYILTVNNTFTKEARAFNIKVLSTIVENKDLVKYYKNSSKYSVKVLDDNGNPLSNVNVSFNINGVFYTRSTDSNGFASLNINLRSGDYIITAEYGTLMVSNNIKVLSTVLSSDLEMNYRDGSAFRATVLDGNGKPYSNQPVSFNINGVLYSRISNSSGMVSLNINLPSGRYIITTSYNGLDYANTIIIH